MINLVLKFAYIITVTAGVCLTVVPACQATSTSYLSHSVYNSWKSWKSAAI